MARLVSGLCLCVALSLTAGQSEPKFNKLQDGRVRAVIPGFPGVSGVLITIQGKESSPEVFTATETAEGSWQTTVSDVTTPDDGFLHYVVKYDLGHSHHVASGYYHLPGETKALQTLNSPRYLQRRTTVVFSDDFHHGSIDLTKWKYAITGFGGGSNQVSMRTPEPANSFVRNNQLFIKPTLTVDHFGEDFLKNGNLDVAALWGNCTSVDVNRGCNLTGPSIPPIMSAMLMTKVSIRYGKVTVNARLPRGDWIWPAIWLLPEEELYGPWPNSGEIDVMESRGNVHYRENHGHHESRGTDYTHGAIHYGWRWDKAHRKSHSVDYVLPSGSPSFADRFHDFWMDWTEDHIRIGVDDHTVLAWDTPSQGYWQEGHFHGHPNIWANGTKAAPFDRPFYLILEVQVAGGYFWSGMVNSPYPQPWNASSPREQQFRDFWNARHLWEPTWHGDNVAMRVHKVTMEQY